jgi:hypothetical protein
VLASLTRFPLCWPAGWRRVAPSARRRAQFHGTGTQIIGERSYRVKRDLTVADSVGRLLGEIRRLGVVDGDVLVSTNLRTRIDGLPYSKQAEPADPGVAVYFRLDDKDRCLACDGYVTVAGNLAAVAAHIEAMRAIERYGVGSRDQAFAGYTALVPGSNEQEWWHVLGVEANAPLALVDDAFRTLALKYHPDRGGSHEEMARITAARAAAYRAAVVSR